MSLFFIAEDVGLKGIIMPLDETNVVDVEFANYKSLYLDGQLINLQKMYTTFQTFCMTLGASINWNKPMVFWVASYSLHNGLHTLISNGFLTKTQLDISDDA